MREAEIAEQMARLAVSGKAGLLRIGFGIASLAAGLPGILTRFRQHFPEVQVTMRDMSTPDQIEALERGDIDVGFVRLPVERPELVTLPVLEETLVAVVPRGMSYRKGLFGLRNEPFVFISRSLSVSFFDHLVQTCRAAGFSPRTCRRSTNCSRLSIRAGGRGCQPGSALASLMRVPDVRLLDTKLPEAKWRIGLAWRKSTKRPSCPKFRNIARRPRHAARLEQASNSSLFGIERTPSHRCPVGPATSSLLIEDIRLISLMEPMRQIFVLRSRRR